MPSRDPRLEKHLAGLKSKIDRRLRTILKERRGVPRQLAQAMTYSLFSGGKRIRPLLCLLAAQVCGGRVSEALDPACAVELVHTYTLIHDDLPCMDDDDVRRGRPTCHRKFGEMIALLSGDALLTLAFEVLSTTKKTRARESVRELARAIGPAGIIAGQVEDMAVGKKKTASALLQIGKRKTGLLLGVSARIGGLAAGVDEKAKQVLERFGQCIGLSFQLIDDVLDRDGYARVAGREEARRRAIMLTRGAQRSCEEYFGRRAAWLNRFADYLVLRRA